MCGADFLSSALCDRLGNFLDLGAGDEQGNVEHVVTKCLELWSALRFSHQPKEIDTYRVSSDVDSLLLAVLNQVIALEYGVALDLVGGRDDTGAINESLELRGVLADVWRIWGKEDTNMLNLVVGDTDGTSLALGELSHG